MHSHLLLTCHVTPWCKCNKVDSCSLMLCAGLFSLILHEDGKHSPPSCFVYSTCKLIWTKVLNLKSACVLYMVGCQVTYSSAKWFILSRVRSSRWVCVCQGELCWFCTGSFWEQSKHWRSSSTSPPPTTDAESGVAQLCDWCGNTGTSGTSPGLQWCTNIPAWVGLRSSQRGSAPVGLWGDVLIRIQRQKFKCISSWHQVVFKTIKTCNLVFPSHGVQFNPFLLYF